MSKPTTPLDSEIAKIFGNNTRIFRAMRKLFKQAGDLSPAAIEEALIAAGNAATAANQANDTLERIKDALELIVLAPEKEDRVTDDDLSPIAQPEQPIGIIIQRIASYTASVTLKIDEGMVFLDANGGIFTITLPFAAGATKRVIRLKRTESSINIITIASQAGDNVEAGATITIPGGSLGFVDLVSDGIDWWVIG